jgi:DNA polymerase-3 subunit delta'
MFRRAVERGRLAHAYLFVGPDGVGKRLFALELAKALLCERNELRRLEACGQCEACVLVEARTHPDFFLVEKPSDAAEEKVWTISLTPIPNRDKAADDGGKTDLIPIHVMRELCRLVGHKSARGRGRVVVIADADGLHREPANCFLKTLEEPPPGSVFILICTRLDNQQETVLSRCQVIRFPPLSTELVGTILQRQQVDAALIPKLVHLAAGSPGQALELTEPELWKQRGELLRGLAQPKIDTVGLAKRFSEFVEDAGKETALQRRRARLVLRLLVEAWAEALKLQLSGSAAATASEESALIQSLARRAQPDQILRLLERCLETETHLDRYVQVGLVLEALLDALGRILET